MWPNSNAYKDHNFLFNHHIFSCYFINCTCSSSGLAMCNLLCGIALMHIRWVQRSQNEATDFISRVDGQNCLGSWMQCGGHIMWTVLQITAISTFTFSSQESIVLTLGRANAVCHDWSGVVNWCCPLMIMYSIPRLVMHARACNARGTLLVPHWQSAVVGRWITL